MFQRSLKVVCSCLVLALCASSAFALAVTEEFQETHELTANGRISLENINGNVEIEGWDRDTVQIDYTKKAQSQEGLDRMDVQIDASSSGITITTEYRKQDDWGSRRHSGSVHFVLYVPRNARIDEIDLVNGNLELRHLDGEVAVEVVNGNIDAIGLTGQVEISSVNGATDIAFDHLAAGQRVDMESVNGSLSVSLPSDADAQVHAETVHGPIENDFGWQVEKGRYVGRSMAGSLGSGGARVDLENVNGSITVRSR